MQMKNSVLICILMFFIFGCKQDIRTCANCTIPSNAVYIIEAKKGSITKLYYSVRAVNNTYQFINIKDTIEYLMLNGYIVDTFNIGSSHILPPIGKNLDVAIDSFKKMYPTGNCSKFEVDCDKCDLNCTCCQK